MVEVISFRAADQSRENKFPFTDWKIHVRINDFNLRVNQARRAILKFLRNVYQSIFTEINKQTVV